ncbi:H(+)-transporting V0 sector ATPase subunit d [Naganishia albida]|nr:H(+)-transporting V0 sector ATPase subunit d [Naganishia albida]
MEALGFNMSAGYLEGVVRGYKGGLLTQAQYNNLTQCENLEDFRLQLSATDYGNFLANEPLPLSTATIGDKATEKLVAEFNYIRTNAVEPLATFMDYITYSYMIDNVILLTLGTLHERDTHELLERCHPLGVFDTMPALCVATNVEELYHSVIVETPLAPYFQDCLSAQDLDDLNIEIIRNTLYKSYLEDFSNFCQTLPAPTNELMSRILAFEADRRTINITLNSFGTELTKEQRARLFPTIGRLFPEGNNALARAEDVDSVKAAVEHIAEYKAFFDAAEKGLTTNNADDNELGAAGGDAEGTSLEDEFYKYEMRINLGSFLQQFQYSVFYSFIRLKEQEIRNLVWIAECIMQDNKERINDYILVN